MYSYLEVADGVYIPRNPDEYPTDNAQQHLVEVKKAKPGSRQFAFDETYPYIDQSFSYWLNRNIIGPPFLWIVIYTVNRLKYGLRIKGRRNLRAYRQALKGGAVAVCNHVYQFDAVCVKQALSPWRNFWIPMYAKHFNGSQYWFVRYVGGIPMPETRGGMRKFDEAFDEYHRRGDLILVFPEEVRWDFYTPIRPFRKGAFTMAYKYNAPVIPCAIRFRQRTGIYRLFGPKDLPLMTIHVGEPLMPDTSKSRKEETERLRREAHAAMIHLAGITHNPWDAVPDDEQRPSQTNPITNNT